MGKQPPIRDTDPVDLDGRAIALPPALGPDVLAALGGIKSRRRLLRSELYQRHEPSLAELTYALEHRPSPRAAPPEPRDFVRVAAWNIERGLKLDLLAAFISQHDDLQHVDILMLNEVDVGMARSGNRHVAAELADRLGFGFVFGSSYLCLDHGDTRDGVQTERNRESLHGNAILSRFPFRRAESFSVTITRDKFQSSEKRLGHKKALWAEVETPLGRLPVVSVHLDSYASSAQRAAQLRDALLTVRRRGLHDRVLIGGDFNTTTYDAASVGQICRNLCRKLVRGGFPHAVRHYLYPDELYERPVFAELEAEGYDFAAFNALGVGTTRYEVGSFESESKVTDRLPGFAAKLLRYKLRPWNGVVGIKVDWFCGRGLEVVQGPGGSEAGVAVGRSPAPIVKPTVDGTPLSDHDPILVDVRF
jgi:endonuclease/exonuclease/phosphatase family metal-dependent hydrolase